MDESAPIRNYQRIFRPEHRIYAIDGRTIPVPGGVPLWWLAYFAATLVTIMILQSGTLFMGLLLAALAGLYGLYVGTPASAAVAAIVAFLLVPVGGGALGQIDWPLRLVIFPALIATLCTQLASDGRKPHRYAATWLTFLLRPHRRSLGRPVPLEGAHRAPYAPQLWVAPDHHSAQLRHGRLHGPGRVRFRDELALSSRGRRRRVLVARRLDRDEEPRRGEDLVDEVELDDTQTLMVRP